MIHVSDYVSNLKKTDGFGYWLGTYGSIATPTLWSQKSKQIGLESWYASHANAYTLWLGKRVVDCIGLDKYARWLRADGSVPYDRATDYNEETLYRMAKANGTLNVDYGSMGTMPDIAGIAVGYTGHVGFYMGNGIVRESRGGNYGVKEYKTSERPWEYWYKNPLVNYGEKFMTIIQRTDPTTKGAEVLTVQKALNQFGATLALDRSFGGLSETAQKAFETKNGLTVDGKVDFFDLIKMIDLYDAKVISLNGQIASLTKTNSILVADTMTLNTRIASLNSELATERDNLTEAILEVNTLTAKADGLFKSVSELTEKLRISETINLDLNYLIDDLNAELDDVKTELEAKVTPIINWEQATLGQLLKQIGKIIFNLKA